MIVFNHQFGKFSHSCCVDSQTSVTRQAGRQRKELLADGDRRERVRSAAPPAVHDYHGRRSRQKTRRCRSSVMKKHRSCSRRKSLINIAQWGVARLVVVVKGSGVDEWPCMKLVCVFKYILVYLNIGMPIKLFSVRKSGEGGGGSKKLLLEYGFKKNLENYGGPLTSLWSSFLSVLALGPTVILGVYSCLALDLGPDRGTVILEI